MAREALLIGNSRYDDSRLSGLRAPSRDAAALAGALGDPEIGGFDTQALLDQPTASTVAAIERFFADRRPDDMLVLYFSGHGLKDATGALYLAAQDTRLDDLATTAITADLISSCVQRSRSRRVVLVLDCCYSGAFPRGMVLRADQTVHVQERFRGRGLIIITASSAIEYAFEDGALSETIEPRPSVFTRALVEGLESGAADANRDGEITVDEIYDFVFDAVREDNPRQTPCRWVFGAQGRFVLARRRTDAPPPPPAPPLPAPLLFRPRRRLGLLALVPLILAVPLVWLGWQRIVLSMLFAGMWLVVVGLRLVVTSQWGFTELSRDGVRVRRFGVTRVRWPSILAMEVRPTLTGRTVSLRRADTAMLHRLTLPSPRTDVFARDVEFRDGVQTIRRWSERWGSPAPVLSTSRATAARGALVAVAVIAILLSAVDRPWTWATGPQAVTLPRACDVLDDETAKHVWNPGSVLTRRQIVSNGRTPETGSQCAVNYQVFLLDSAGSLELNYELLSSNTRTSGIRRASAQLAEHRGRDRAEGYAVWDLPEKAGAEGHVAAFPPDDAHPSNIRLRARHANVVVTVQFTRGDNDYEPPAQEKLQMLLDRAVDHVQLAGR
ncbi:caspase family protein [Micromonospora sp. NPDC049301]|uniref:caspase family protein n=1 Tax=Micromonospora sp. NPDC049301 TaxID=3155723 RepID=UPI0034438BBA